MAITRARLVPDHSHPTMTLTRIPTFTNTCLLQVGPCLVCCFIHIPSLLPLKHFVKTALTRHEQTAVEAHGVGVGHAGQEVTDDALAGDLIAFDQGALVVLSVIFGKQTDRLPALVEDGKETPSAPWSKAMRSPASASSVTSWPA